uniref:Uncharacterized protein n=1 Tax=Phenylobacterium glaciei TaxID=2803784 RepID=A0A974S7Y7_9CAUL|nr:hypothetical protein JKL49_23565 [Phenylobacterium glaciei]
MRLTLADWALFAIDQMAGEQGRGKLLKPATYRLLHTPQGDTNAALGWGVRTWPKGRLTRMLALGLQRLLERPDRPAPRPAVGRPGRRQLRQRGNRGRAGQGSAGRDGRAGPRARACGPTAR